VKSIKLNGKVMDKNFITHINLTKGGKLVFKMGDKPEKKRGTDEVDYPYSMSRN
jgi:putative alpha-1,2-mannosidase